MNVLVTGATGFIGSHLCRALAGAGHRVLALSRNPEAARRRLPMLAAAYAWNAPKDPPPAQAFEGVDAVVNLAGETLQGRWTEAKRRAIRDTRVEGTRLLVQAMEQASPRPSVLVSASASGYYGDRGEEPLTEASSAGSGFLAEVCVAWEREVNAARSMGVRVVNLRSGLVLGLEGGAVKGLLLPYKLGGGGPLGNGRQWWPWVHIQDEVGVILHGLAGGVEGPVNSAAPNPVRQRDFAKALGKAVHRPAVLPAPAFALRLAFGEVATELLYSRRATSQRLQASGYRFRFPTLPEAIGDLVR